MPIYQDSGSGGVSGNIGDAKAGFQTADHSGWILLNGRLKTALTPTQQVQATFLGFGVNIPNVPVGAALIKGAVGSAVGSATISQANLPSVNLVGGNHGHGISDPGHNHTVTAIYHSATGDGFNNGRIQLTDRTGFVATNPSEMSLSAAGTGISVVASGNLSIPLGGSGSAYTPLGLGVNMFVYLGL